MKILHYFLGFPPYRSGGLTKYSFDLMTAQAQMGEQVSALWPGQMGLVSKKVHVRSRGKVQGVDSYELCGPLPVALDEGVADAEAYMTPCQGQGYKAFLQQLQPDVIHIHTLMGLHTEFLDAAKALGIRTVFTTHDYYGICPKVTLYRGGDACQNDGDCQNCVACNLQGLSLKKIWIMQSGLYRALKNTPVVKALRKRHRGAFFAEQPLPELPEGTDAALLARQYRRLRQYYLDMLSKIDLIHFNSSLTESIYRRYMTPADSKVLTITHKDICDRRDLPHEASQTLRITCLAPAKPFKGYSVLRQALDGLWNEGKRDFVLRMFSPVDKPAPYMQVQEEGFDHAQLPRIMAQTDVLVAPSVWYETFGFTVAEALSFGVPVIVSDRMGAKDVVGDGGIVIPAGSVRELEDAIRSLTPQKLETMRQQICRQPGMKAWDTFLEENRQLYQPAPRPEEG